MAAAVAEGLCVLLGLRGLATGASCGIMSGKSAGTAGPMDLARDLARGRRTGVSGSEAGLREAFLLETGTRSGLSLRRPRALAFALALALALIPL